MFLEVPTIEQQEVVVASSLKTMGTAFGIMIFCLALIVTYIIIRSNIRNEKYPLINRKIFKRWSESIKDKNPHYYKLMTKFYAIEHYKPSSYINLFDVIKEHSSLMCLLPKNTIQYETSDELRNDIYKYVDFYIKLTKTSGFIKSYLRTLPKDEVKRLIHLKNDIDFDNIYRGYIDVWYSFLKRNNFNFVDDRKES